MFKYSKNKKRAGVNFVLITIFRNEIFFSEIEKNVHERRNISIKRCAVILPRFGSPDAKKMRTSALVSPVVPNTNGSVLNESTVSNRSNDREMENSAQNMEGSVDEHTVHEVPGVSSSQLDTANPTQIAESADESNETSSTAKVIVKRLKKRLIGINSTINNSSGSDDRMEVEEQRKRHGEIPPKGTPLAKRTRSARSKAIKSKKH